MEKSTPEIWSGVVGSYPDLLYHWHHPPATNPNPTDEPPASGELVLGYPTQLP